MLLNNYHLLLPEIYLTITINFLLFFGLFFLKWNSNKLENKGGAYNLLNKFIFLGILTLIWTFILLFNNHSGYISDIFIFNNFNNYIKEIITISTIFIVLISQKFLSIYKIKDFEYLILIFLSLLGFFLLVSSNNLLIMYLAIETISLSLYVLAAIRRNNTFSTEAGLKYFILGALSSGLLLFGCALVYYSTGIINFTDLANISEIKDNSLLIGSIFIIISLLFKLAAAPFHMWAPDVYEGSPTIVTFYFAIIPKISILYILYILLYGPFYSIFIPNIQNLLLLVGILSIIIGTFGAIYQNRIIRLIAFSGIAHIGFIILGFSTGTFISVYSSFIYIIVYIIMSFNTFSFILSIFPNKKYFIDLLSYYKFNPLLTISFAFTLLSIAGIPPLAGFFTKFYILFNLIENNFYFISIIAIILSVVASYYYIRIIQFMFFNKSSLFNFYYTVSSLPKLGLIQSIVLGSTTYFILTFLLYPKPILLLTFDFFY